LRLISCAILLIGAASQGRAFELSLPALTPHEPIPAKYTLKGGNVSPEVAIKDVPPGTQSLALIVDDPDAPTGLWTHWLVWNLSADTTTIPEGKLPSEARQGTNSYQHVAYDGPAPPPGDSHRYYFRLYALNALLTLPEGADHAALIVAMSGHVLGKAEVYRSYPRAPLIPE